MSRCRHIALAAVLLASPAGGLSAQAAPLTLEEVLDSARRHYPPLIASMLQVEAAEGNRRAAEGSFDTDVRLGSTADRLGFYDNYHVDLGLEQAFRFWGAKVYAGWRLGQGGFAPYDGLRETRDRGVVLAGLKLPLLRDRAIDPARAELQRRRLGVALAELSVAEQRLLIQQLASWSYWDWVAAGGSLSVAQGLLDLALARDDFLRASVEAGALPAIEITDNRRAILKRRSDLVSAEQKLRQAAIYLSLYLRDELGEPIIAGAERLPEAFPDPEPVDVHELDDAIELAISRRPELLGLRTQAEQKQLDERVFDNATLPSLDLTLGVAAEAGENPAVQRGPTDLKAGLAFTLPLQRRTADGRRQKARAEVASIRQKERFLTEKIAVEVRAAATALAASYEKTVLLDEEVSVTGELESLERERFDLGDTNLFTVNLREAATADAAMRRIEALSEYYRARAFYNFVIAEP